MTRQMKPHTLNPFDPISINGFLKNDMLACDTNGVHEGATMWLFHFCMNKTALTVRNPRLRDDNKNTKYCQSANCKRRYLTTSPRVFNFLLKKYATDEVVAETESEILLFARPTNIMPFYHAEELVTKTLCCGVVKEDTALKKILIEGLGASTRHSMRKYWGNKKHTNLHDLTFHAT